MEEKPILLDMLNREIKIGDVMVLPTSKQGYSQRFVLIKELPVNPKTGNLTNISVIKLNKAISIDVKSWYDDKIQPKTLSQYGVIITDIISKDQLDVTRLLLIN